MKKIVRDELYEFANLKDIWPFALKAGGIN